MKLWVKINAGSVANDKDSKILHKLQVKYNGNYNTHNYRSMWFDFPSNKLATGFAVAVVKQFPYLSVTMGQIKD